MTYIELLEKRFGKWAIPNLTFWLLMSQILFFALNLFSTFPVPALLLIPGQVLQGEIWRLVTFLLLPPSFHLSVFLLFAWYLFYLYGSALEAEWGAFKFNSYVLIGTLATVLAAMTGYWLPGGGPGFVATNGYLLSSIFLAFAYRNPNFELLLFFILPLKIKWLAMLTWGIWGVTLLFGPPALKLIVLGACVNFFLFFGRDIRTQIRARKRRQSMDSQRMAEADTPFHRCAVCGLTDKDDPEMDFVYEGGKGYCREHADQVDRG